MIKYNLYMILLLLLLTASACLRAVAMQSSPPPDLTLSICGRSLDPLSAPSDDWGIKEIQWPEYYIDPVLNHGLDLFLPVGIRQKLSMTAGYDRWKQSPTISLDYSSTLWETPNGRLFLLPHLAYEVNDSQFSLGASYRKIALDNLFISLNAWHNWRRIGVVNKNTLGQFVAGVEVGALPGLHSDLTFSANFYSPSNAVETYDIGNSAFVQKSLAKGADARLSLKLPAINKHFDTELSGSIATFKGIATDTLEYSAGASIAARNGLARLRADYSYTSNKGAIEDNLSVGAEFTMVFDWLELSMGENPFSAPYSVGADRYDRDLSQELNRTASKQNSTPVDEVQRPRALQAAIFGNSVRFQAGFQDLPNQEILVQTSQSPWITRKVIYSDDYGFCSGKIQLAPGRYLLRLLHQKTGRASSPIEVNIEQKCE